MPIDGTEVLIEIGTAFQKFTMQRVVAVSELQKTVLFDSLNKAHHR